MIKELLKKPFYRYLIVGGSIYLLEVAVIVLAQRQGLSAVASVGVAFWVGLVVSFVMQKFVTFSDKRTHHKILIPQALAFTALVFFNFGFTLLFTKLVVSIIPAAIARGFALGITTFWNFFLYKTRIFKNDEPTVY